MKHGKISLRPNILFYKWMPLGLMSLILVVYIILKWTLKQRKQKNLMDTALFKEKFWKEENLRINILNIHFWQPTFKFRLSGQHLGLACSFQIMVCRVLSQFPRRELGIAFPQVFSIKDASSSLPTSPTSAHKKMNNGTHMCQLVIRFSLLQVQMQVLRCKVEPQTLWACPAEILGLITSK